MKLISLTATVVVWAGLIAPNVARAAGGPVPPVQGSGIGVPGSPYRYVAVDAGRDTIVKVNPAEPRPAVSALRVSGHYGIPGVDYNGGTTGLSADGRTLVLAQIPRSTPPRTTRLLVLSAPHLIVRTRLALPGWSTVDAISPDGRWLYLIHYASSDISRYAVRAYDVVAGRLLPKPVVDPHDRGEAMTGFPIIRVMSDGGRWAYTLYIRPSGAPFVHALDTAGLRAVCIDLPSLSSTDAGTAQLGLTPGGRRLKIAAGGVTRAMIDTHTFTVAATVHHTPPAPVRSISRAHRASPGKPDLPWTPIALLTAALGMLAAGARIVRFRRQRDYRRDPDGATTIYVDAQHQ